MILIIIFQAFKVQIFIKKFTNIKINLLKKKTIYTISNERYLIFYIKLFLNYNKFKIIIKCSIFVLN